MSCIEFLRNQVSPDTASQCNENKRSDVANEVVAEDADNRDNKTHVVSDPCMYFIDECI